jgi:hypothetical protein
VSLIGYFLQGGINCDCKASVQDRRLPDAISMRAYRIVIGALNIDTHIREFEDDAGQGVVDLFADCKCMMDRAIDDNPPIDVISIVRRCDDPQRHRVR